MVKQVCILNESFKYHQQPPCSLLCSFKVWGWGWGSTVHSEGDGLTAFSSSACTVVLCQAALLQRQQEKKSRSLLECFQSTQIKHLKPPSSETYLSSTFSKITGYVVRLPGSKSSLERSWLCDFPKFLKLPWSRFLTVKWAITNCSHLGELW